MNMKCIYITCLLGCLCIFCDAQISKTGSTSRVEPDKINISLLKDRLFITERSKRVPLANFNSLDSLVKKIPGPGSRVIHVETENADPEKIGTVMGILRKCACHITEHHVRLQ